MHSLLGGPKLRKATTLIKAASLRAASSSNANLNIDMYEFIATNGSDLRELVNKLIKERGQTVDLNVIDVSRVEDFSNIFYNKKFFNGNISEWDVGNGKNFNSMFNGCKNLECDLSKWDKKINWGQVVDSMNMFKDCSRSFSKTLKTYTPIKRERGGAKPTPII